jgi:hypothetical protein
MEKTAGLAAPGVRRERLTRTVAILDAALRVWETKQPGYSNYSVWRQRENRPHSEGSGRMQPTGRAHRIISEVDAQPQETTDAQVICVRCSKPYKSVLVVAPFPEHLAGLCPDCGSRPALVDQDAAAS